MNDDMYAELLESVREGGKILRGEAEASRTRSVNVDAQAARRAREALGLSRSRFATVLGISERTLEGWEQGRRAPSGPARTLLQVAVRHPEAVLETLHTDRPREAS